MSILDSSHWLVLVASDWSDPRYTGCWLAVSGSMTPACHDKLTWASRPGLGIIILHFVEKVVNFNFLIVLGVSVLLAQLHSTQQQQIDLTTTDVGIYCPWFPRSNNVSPLTKMSGSWGQGAGLLSEQSWLSPLPFVLSLGETQQISLSKALKPFADVM